MLGVHDKGGKSGDIAKHDAEITAVKTCPKATGHPPPSRTDRGAPCVCVASARQPPPPPPPRHKNLLRSQLESVGH